MVVNSIEERRAMRAASSAPRNSRELAVRNQFFTPRYVVEFLTDNTLGRIWYEMTRGQTELVDRCRYLVRKPDEAIPERKLKDPREIRMLDPACGSMHFGLYAFDLFEVIYREAWRLEDERGYNEFERKEHSKSLHETYETEQDFLRDVPRLILENNIHGIDIDPRAAQIAGLSLWLRAQRAWKEMDLPAGARPQIRKANVVCAEPMPGERDMLEEFADSLHPKVLGALLKKIFAKMELAGDAGSLLRIEEDIRSEIEDAHKAYKSAKDKKPEVAFLDGFEPPKPAAEQSLFDFSDLDTDDDFWSTAEEKLVNALRAYAESAADGSDRKRLFAADAARGFALIDILKRRFDVSLQNPPFGKFSEKFKEASRIVYPNSYNDIFAAFIDRSLELLNPGGMLGAITSRTGFYISSFLKWRENVILGQAEFSLMADIGGSVMDDAMVESAAYCMKKGCGNSSAIFIRVLGKSNRESEIFSSISKVNGGGSTESVFIQSTDAFRSLPSIPFAYWIDVKDLRRFGVFDRIQENVCNVCQGLVTGNDFRFVRTLWEVPNEKERRWVPYAIAGSSQPWYSPLMVGVDWKQNGKVFHIIKTCRIGNERFFLRAGLSWPFRSVRMFPYAVPSGSIPSAVRYMIFPHAGCELNLAGILGSNLIASYLRCFAQWFTRSPYLVDTVKNTPWPGEGLAVNEKLNAYVSQQILGRRAIYRGYEPFQEFVCPAQLTEWENAANPLAFDFYHLLPEELDNEIAAAYGFDPEEAKAICRDLFEAIENRNGSCGEEDEEDGEEDEGNPLGEDVSTANFKARALVSYAVGCALGRWDVEYATGKKVAEMPSDPFAPLPAQSPGCLTEEEFRRVTSGGAYPIRVPKDGVLVDEEGPDGLVRRVQNVLAIIWGANAAEKELELAKALGVRELADYLMRPNGFFADHLLTYTKSRRAAPIYWPLSTKNGRYTLWLAYHRIDGQSLYKCVNDYIEPKLKRVAEESGKLKLLAVRSAGQEDELEALVELEDELKDLRDELLRVAKFWKPNLNDGVQITAAPLWRLFRLRPWQQKLKKTWESLEAGQYDWSHLALGIWPERVVNAAHGDRSIAIAHDLESELWEEVAVTRRGRTMTEWRPKDLTPDELKQIVEAVKER